jgi:hypothetical protein
MVELPLVSPNGSRRLSVAVNLGTTFSTDVLGCHTVGHRSSFTFNLGHTVTLPHSRVSALRNPVARAGNLKKAAARSPRLWTASS